MKFNSKKNFSKDTMRTIKDSIIIFFECQIAQSLLGINPNATGARGLVPRKF